MSQEVKNIFWVCGIYNWPATIDKEFRHKNKDYPRYNWCDIDTKDPQYLKNVLKVFENYKISCISQICGKGAHVWGDIVPFETWLKIWTEIKPYADPRWAPHTLRISKKRPDEIWERPVFHNFSGLLKPKPWMQALMSFLCKAMRGENSSNLKAAVHQVGLDKYFQCPTYPVEIKK